MPSSIEALFVIGLVLTPGFICLWICKQIIRAPSKLTDLELILSTIALGVLVNAVLFPCIGSKILEKYSKGVLLEHEWLVFTWCVLTILIVPIILGFLLGKAINTDHRLLGLIRLDALSRTPDAWDFAMNKDQGCYVIVRFKDGSSMAGTFGVGSFASSDKDRKDLFLEKQWHLNQEGYFDEPEIQNEGVWISHDSIERVEFIR